MTLFIQGMRRSGTTILYDALLEDPELTCFYEPFGMAKAAVGGGSGVRDEDLFAPVRAAREEFRRTHRPQLDADLLNYGAPRQAELELEDELPDFCREYLRFLLDSAPNVVAKLTRMYAKVAALAEVEPAAGLVHLVRDPRAVATSYLMGRGRRREHLFDTADHFFEHRSPRSMWASRPLSQALMARPEHAHLEGCPDFVRVLLVWRFTFERTRAGGVAAFGERYRMLRHEDLCADPAGGIQAVYELMGRPPPPSVVDWATANVRAPDDVFASDDARWGEALAWVGLEPALAQAGYGGLVRAG